MFQVDGLSFLMILKHLILIDLIPIIPSKIYTAHVHDEYGTIEHVYIIIMMGP